MASNSDILPVLMSVSPITTAIYAAGFGRGGSAVSLSGLLGTPALRMHLGFQAFVFLSSAWVAWRGLIRKEVERAAVAKRIVDDKAILERRRKRWPYYLIDPLRRAQEIGDRENPVFVKEKRVSNLAKPHVLIRICYVGLFLSIISLFAVFQEQPLEAAKFVALWTISFVIACAPILASTSVSREREENTLDLLRTSMVTPWGIIWAKFSIALRFLAYLCASFVLLPILLGLSVSLLYPSEQWGTRLVSTFLAFVKIIPFLLSFSALYAAVGIYCSSKSRKNVTAIVSTYGWSGVFLLFPLLLTWFSAIIEAWWYRDRRRDWLSPLLISIRDWAGPLLSPYYYFSDGFRSRYSDGRHNFANWDSWGQIAVHTLLMLGLTGAILKLAEWRLKRSVRQ
ncbi:hypothetical protein HYR69_10160 [Candidatus Sumerlaeota bacterium]|nr:hypothetical protein [Candidatus Sumerlaeota bacterium]